MWDSKVFLLRKLFCIHVSCIYSVNTSSGLYIDYTTLFRTWRVESWPGTGASYVLILVSKWVISECIHICIYLCANMPKCFAKCLSVMNYAIVMSMIYIWECLYIHELVMINHMWYRNAYDENVKLVICWKHVIAIIIEL